MPILKREEPVFMCFCGITNFHHFKLGFDWTFWIGEISNKKQADYDYPFRCGRAAGHSFIIAEDDYEQITNHPKTLKNVIVSREEGV